MATKAGNMKNGIRTASVMSEIGNLGDAKATSLKVLKRLEMLTCSTCPW